MIDVEDISMVDVSCVDNQPSEVEQREHGGIPLFHNAMMTVEASAYCQQFDDVCTERLRRVQYKGDDKVFAAWLISERMLWRILSKLIESWRSQRMYQLLHAFDEKNREERLTKIMVSTLQDEYKERAEDLNIRYSYLSQNMCDWRDTLMMADQSNRMSRKRADIFMDPDGPFTGSPLTTQDQMTDLKILEIVFAFIRSGDKNRAVQLLEDVSQHWRAGLIRGCSFAADPDEFCLEEGEENRLYKKTVSRLVEMDGLLPVYEKVILSSLAGDSVGVWPACRTLDDWWWSMCNSLIVSKRSSSSKSHTSCPKIMGLFSVFDITRDKAPPDIVNESREPLRRFQQLLFLEELQDVIEFAHCTLSDLARNQQMQAVDYELARVCLHVSIILFQSAPASEIDYKWERLNYLLSSYISILLMMPKQSWKLIPLYIAMMSRNTSNVTELSRVLDATETLDDCMMILEECVQQNVKQEVVNAAVHKYLEHRRVLYQSIFNDERLGNLTEIDADTIKELSVFLPLSALDKTEILKHALAICRLCILVSDDFALRTLIANLNELVPDSFTDGTNLPLERNDIIALSTFNGSVQRWMSSFGEGPNETNTAMAKELLENVKDILTRPGGWMVDNHISTDPTDPYRYEQMKVLRSVQLPRVISTAASVCDQMSLSELMIDLNMLAMEAEPDVACLMSKSQLNSMLNMISGASLLTIEPCDANEDENDSQDNGNDLRHVHQDISL